jgi:tetratricopeptide (TPR) repeat protein
LQGKTSTLLLGLVLIAATGFCFWPLSDAGFIHLDDDVYVTANPQVTSGLTLTGAVWAFTSTHAANWHPLTWLSHMLDCQLYGLNPAGHHASSVLLHLSTVLLLFIVFQRMTGTLWQSGFVAALFALHPLHVESVAWVAERKDVLSTLFWVLTMGAYARYAEGRAAGQSAASRERGVRGKRGSYLLVLLFFALGLMSKPTLVTLPFVLLLLDYWPLGRMGRTINKDRLRPLVLEKLPLFMLSAVSSAVTFLVQRSGGAVGLLELLPLEQRIANALVSYVAYIGKMLWPWHLAVYYPYDENLPLWQVVGAALLLLAITAAVVRFGRKRPYLRVGWFWYLGTLVPMIGLVQVGGQAMADRYTYVPMIGLFVMIAMAVPEVLNRWRCRKKVMALSAGIILVALLAVGRSQASLWRNSIRLFDHSLAAASDNYLIRNNLGNALERMGRVDEAIGHYRESLRIAPGNAEVYFNLANAISRKGKAHEAIALYAEALRLRPDYAEAHNNLGSELDRLGQIADAMAHYREAVRLKPDYVEAVSNVGVALAKQGQAAEALPYFEKAIRIDPRYEKAYHNRGVALFDQGRVREAIASYDQAVRINPGFVEARYSLALAYVTIGDRQACWKQYTALSTINPDLAERLLAKIPR